jgi:hypothetical protein
MNLERRMQAFVAKRCVWRTFGFVFRGCCCIVES